MVQRFLHLPLRWASLSTPPRFWRRDVRFFGTAAVDFDARGTGLGALELLD